MLPMSSGAGEITHTSDLTSVKYLTAVKRRLREKNMFPRARCTIFKNLQVTKYKLQVISY
jgi:hypothetical protein